MARRGTAGQFAALLLAGGMEPAAAEAPASIRFDAVLTGMAQQVDAAGSANGRAEFHLNYRGDLSATLAGGSRGQVAGTGFIQVRFGQGTGVGLRPTYTSTPNTTAFELASGHPDAAFAVLAQAWYQVEVSLSAGGAAAAATQRLSITAGKIDPFVFFDQNAAADDESRRFTNNAFVHNPLLDSGADAGVDAYGFAPGLRVTWARNSLASSNWSVSLGAFGSGEAAGFSGPPERPFVIGQIDASTSRPANQPGNYRLYLWRNGRAEDFDGTVAAHSGWGVSVDQRVGAALTLFGRYGDRRVGSGTFNRALTLGAELGGNDWQRRADAFGIGLGWLRTSRDYRAATADAQLAGYAASGAERIAEIYYRFELGGHLSITPDLQWIHRPGGDDGARSTMIAGLRARLSR
jgi:hypothetical protein